MRIPHRTLNGLSYHKSELKSRRGLLWEELFCKPRACLRASMLPKQFAWGLHFDGKGRIAFVAVGSERTGYSYGAKA